MGCNPAGLRSPVFSETSPALGLPRGSPARPPCPPPTPPTARLPTLPVMFANLWRGPLLGAEASQKRLAKMTPSCHWGVPDVSRGHARVVRLLGQSLLTDISSPACCWAEGGDGGVTPGKLALAGAKTPLPPGASWGLTRENSDMKPQLAVV